MSDSATHSLPRFRAALNRLDRAVGHLESSLTRVPMNRTGETPPPESSAIVGELETLRADHERLDDAARLVESRLDGLIARLSVVVGA